MGEKEAFEMDAQLIAKKFNWDIEATRQHMHNQRKFSQLVAPKLAIAASALGFTIHHVIALQIFLSLPMTALCAFGIFVGGATWSWCYVRYRSIWPAYLSHAIVDLAVFSLGYVLIFL